MVTRGWRWGTESDSYRVLGFTQSDGNVLEVRSDDGCTTSGMYQMPLNCYFKMVNFILCEIHPDTIFFFFFLQKTPAWSCLVQLPGTPLSARPCLQIHPSPDPSPAKLACSSHPARPPPAMVPRSGATAGSELPIQERPPLPFRVRHMSPPASSEDDINNKTL